MGAVGAAIMAATMKGDDNTRNLEDSLTIQRLELEAQNNEKIHELEKSNLKLLLEQELLQKNLEKEEIKYKLESVIREQRMGLTIELQEQTIFYLKQSDNPKSLSQSFDDMRKDKDNITLPPSSDNISRDSEEISRDSEE